MAHSEPFGSEIPIEIVYPVIFEELLLVNCNREPPENMNDPKTMVLEVANRFGCSPLKLIAENEIVKAGINAQNAAELHFFSDAHSCALLREATLEFCVAIPITISESEGWEQLKESSNLLAELYVGASAPKFTGDYDTHACRNSAQKA
jgi:hypothetical protein